jgi:hypothetical protein
MRYQGVSLFAASVLVALAACSDSRLTAPDATTPSQLQAPLNGLASKSGDDKGDNAKKNDEKGDKDRHDEGRDDGCKAGDDRDDHDKSSGSWSTSSSKSKSSSKDGEWTGKDDHRDDEGDDGCGSGNGGTGQVTKKLVKVMTTKNGAMIPDPTWSLGQPVIIPRGETRWLFYDISYAVPKGTSATISEDKASVCGTLGTGFTCSFNTGGKYSWSVSGTSHMEVQVDLTNNSVCGDRTFTNTVVLKPSKGTPASASATTPIKLTCGGTVTVTKVLDHVMTEVMQNGKLVMVNDPTYQNGVVTVPAGETRWIYYKVNYSLPVGVTGTATENEASICNTMGAADVNHAGDGKIHCSINYGGATPAGSMSSGIAKWAGLSNTGSIMVPVDIGSGGLVCGDRTFTNTVVITTSTGQTYPASASTTIRFICTSSATLTKTLVDVMMLNAANQMVSDPSWSPGGPVVIPGTQTRWLEYQIGYTLPSGVMGTLTENEAAVCSTMGTDVNVTGNGKIGCSINYGGAVPTGIMSGGIVSWGSLIGTGSVNVPIDIVNGGLACGTRTLTNTAILKLPDGSTKSVSSSIDIKFVSGGGFTCPP